MHYAGCTAPPSAWLRERYGVDVEADAEALAAELRVQPLPPELRGMALGRRLARSLLPAAA
jgi:hypothetical protein